MYRLSSLAATMVRGTHTIDIYARAYSQGSGATSSLPVTSGSVVVDATSQVRRTATVGIGLDAFWPDDPFDILSPIGSELAVGYGIIIPGLGTEYIPLIRGPITSVRRTIPSSGESAMEVTVADRSSRVADYRFEQPTQTISGATTVAEITRLIQQAIPGVGITDLTGSTKVAPVLDMERDRWADGIEKLADSISAEVFADPVGAFVIRTQPDVTNTPVWTVDAGNGGILLSENDDYSREQVYNRVVASGQRVDGTPPVYAVASDTNPNSPTYINGPFGIKTRFYASPLLTTVGQCQSAADTVLARVTGRHMNVSFTTVTNPALDAGDVLRLILGDRNEVHIIDRVEIPLLPGTPQRIQTRALTLPEEIVA